MNVRLVALIFGIFYTLIGIMGFIPGLISPPGAGDPALAVEAGHGLLLGIFPVNILHTIVHLLIGLWGVFSYASHDASKVFFKINAVLFALLFLMGLVPGLNTTFGLIPLHGNDVWLHALTALVAGYFGYVAAPAAVRPAAAP